eukprot:1195086-Prorocentrum_minimum.AAC.6
MMVRVPERHTPVRPGQEIGRQVQRNVRVAIDGDPSLQAPITGQVPIPFLTAGRCSPRITVLPTHDSGSLLVVLSGVHQQPLRLFRPVSAAQVVEGSLVIFSRAEMLGATTQDPQPLMYGASAALAPNMSPSYSLHSPMRFNLTRLSNTESEMGSWPIDPPTAVLNSRSSHVMPLSAHTSAHEAP